jgi:hypothetical protein
LGLLTMPSGEIFTLPVALLLPCIAATWKAADAFTTSSSNASHACLLRYGSQKVQCSIFIVTIPASVCSACFATAAKVFCAVQRSHASAPRIGHVWPALLSQPPGLLEHAFFPLTPHQPSLGALQQQRIDTVGHGTPGAWLSLAVDPGGTPHSVHRLAAAVFFRRPGDCIRDVISSAVHGRALSSFLLAFVLLIIAFVPIVG